MELVETKELNLQKTELGEIPSDWIASTFGETFTGFSSGMTPFRGVLEYYKGDIPWITSGELNYNIITDTWEKITEEAVFKTNLKIHPVGTFLMAITGLEAAGTRGSCAITGIKATTNQSCMALFPIQGKTITEYLYHFYVRYGNELAFKYCQGTKQQSFTGRIAKKLPINLPPTIDEQKAIAKVLSDTDALIQALEKKIGKKNLVKKGVMQKLFTPKEGWLTKKLHEIGDITGAGVDKKSNKNEQEVKLLNYMDVFNNDYLYQKIFNHKVTAPQTKVKTCNVLKGDIFLTPSSEMRTDIGVSSLAMEDMDGIVYSYHVNRLRYTIDIEFKFGLYILKTRNFLDQVETLCEGSGKRYVLSLSKFKDLEVTFPENKKEQQRISEILYSLDSELEQLEQKLSKYQLAKQGMMQQLLTGKIRLV